MVLFSCRDARPTVSDGHILLFTFLQAFSFQNALRGRNLAFFLFTGILFSVGPSGTPSFVARRKIGEKGVPKGSEAALWKLAFYTGVRRGDVRTFLRVRPNAIYAI